MRPRCAWLILLMSAIVLGPSAGAAEDTERVEIDPVLVVMDVQNVWMDRMDEADVATAPDKINEAIALFRENDCPVIRVYHSHPERGPEVHVHLGSMYLSGQSLLGSTMGTRDEFRTVLGLMGRGAFRPVIDRVFSLADIADAHRYLEGASQTGKVAIRVGDGQ